MSFKMGAKYTKSDIVYYYPTRDEAMTAYHMMDGTPILDSKPYAAIGSTKEEAIDKLKDLCQFYQLYPLRKNTEWYCGIFETRRLRKPRIRRYLNRVFWDMTENGEYKATVYFSPRRKYFSRKKDMKSYS